MVVYVNNRGNDTFFGTSNAYDQVDYEGSLTDYSFSQNANGTVTVSHPQFGTDTLSSIDGFWFSGEGAWYSLEDAVALTSSGNGNGGTVVNGTLTGGNGNDVLQGGSGNDVFYGGTGNDSINGNGGGYNQVDYDGALSDYAFTQNANGSVSVSHPQYGTDTLSDIDGFWFGGEGAWYSMADALANSSGNSGGNSGGTLVDGIRNGGNGNDTLTGGNGDDVFYGGQGNDMINGNGGGYNQVNYDGALADYAFTQNANGTVTVSHPQYGTDTLSDIDGFWFGGEGAWYSTADAVANSGGNTGGGNGGILGGGTLIGGVMTGTTGNNALTGDGDANVFYANRGNDTIDGNGGTDTLNVDGDVIEWTFTQNNNGSVTMTHPTWGQNILTSIELINFGRSGQTFSVADAIAQTAGLPEFRLDNDNVLNGTNGNDVMIGTNADENFYGGVGNDFYNGGGGFDQLNYDGNFSEYTVTQNDNGSFTISHDVWGVDTFQNIEGLFFNGDGAFVSVNELSA